jgi:TolB-like protein
MIYVFRDCALDVARRELRRGADRVAVEPQVFDLLLYLIRSRDHVVSKNELIASVWHGRAVSDSALSSRITAARHAIGDNGEQQLLIRTVARKGLRFVGDIREEPGADAGGEKGAPQTSAGEPAPAEGPSIAVLPFQNMSGDADQEYFADGIVEEIIVGLSRSRALSVIARGSSFTYKGRAVDVKQVGRELGVRYVMEGSVRRAANRVRITSQLIDAASGAHLWADRFDGNLEDIFDLQDQVTASVVGAITPKLEQAEIERAKRKPTASLDAYDYFLRGMASSYQRTRTAIDEALRLFRKAIERDPDFAAAYSMAAWCYGRRKAYGWMADYPEEIAEAAALARRGAELGRDDAAALSRSANALAFVVGDLDAAGTFADRALILNPNLATAWYSSGWVRLYSGEPEMAIEHFARAMRLSPLDPLIIAMQAGTAFAHLLAGRDDEASAWAEKTAWAHTYYITPVRIAAASHARAGRMEEARKAVARLRELDPAMCVANVKIWAPLRRPEHLARLEVGLRMAGLPER